MSRFIVMEKSAKMPHKARGSYIKLAVVEVEKDFQGEPAMISERAKGVVRIVEEWGPCYLGMTEKSAGRRARREAEELCERLSCPLTSFIDAVDAS